MVLSNVERNSTKQRKRKKSIDRSTSTTTIHHQPTTTRNTQTDRHRFRIYILSYTRIQDDAVRRDATRGIQQQLQRTVSPSSEKPPIYGHETWCPKTLPFDLTCASPVCLCMCVCVCVLLQQYASWYSKPPQGWYPPPQRTAGTNDREDHDTPGEAHWEDTNTKRTFERMVTGMYISIRMLF